MTLEIDGLFLKNIGLFIGNNVFTFEILTKENGAIKEKKRSKGSFSRYV